MPAPLDVRPLLDPEIAEVLAAFPLDLGALTNELLPAICAGMGSIPGPPLSDKVTRMDYDIPGREGVSVRVHRPVGVDGPLPCLYWMHGGGLILGSNAGDDARFDVWCQMFNCVGVSVEYRLAPEFPYPIPLEDCYEGLRWVYDNADLIGVNRDQLGIGGASAGGGLAAGLALLARDRAEMALDFQLLIYPMIDDRQITASSGWADPIWPPSANHFGWSAYLAGVASGDVSPYAAPARAIDLAGLPQALISVGALDGFSDEDVDYATRLRHAGVPVELHVYPGAPHGFDALAAGTAIARRAVADMESWLRAVLRAS